MVPGRVGTQKSGRIPTRRATAAHENTVTRMIDKPLRCCLYGSAQEDTFPFSAGAPRSLTGARNPGIRPDPDLSDDRLC